MNGWLGAGVFVLVALIIGAYLLSRLGRFHE